jgi:Flp pilus assembly protein TadD
MVLGMVHQLYDGKWSEAEEAFREAIRLNPGLAEPHHELSMHLMRLRRFDEARREALRTLNLAPLTPRFEHGLGEIHLFAGQYDDAIAQANKALALDSSYAAAYFILAPAYAQQGRFDLAESTLRKCDGRSCAAEARVELGRIYALAGRRGEAERILEELESKWTTHTAVQNYATPIATIHAALGERSQALDWLERGAATGAFMAYVGIDPAFRSLRNEPRFRAVLRKVGLPDSLASTGSR